MAGRGKYVLTSGPDSSCVLDDVAGAGTAVDERGLGLVLQRLEVVEGGAQFGLPDVISNATTLPDSASKFDSSAG